MKTIFALALAAIFATEAAPAQGRMGFVNVQRVILEYEKTAAVTEQLEKELQARSGELRQERAKIQVMKEGLDLFETGSIEQLQEMKKIRLLEVEAELQEKNVQILLEQRLVAHTKKVYQELLKEVEIMARERSLQVVFMVNAREIEGMTRDQVGSNILVRPILWFDPQLDLTSELIQRLNR